MNTMIFRIDHLILVFSIFFLNCSHEEGKESNGEMTKTMRDDVEINTEIGRIVAVNATGDENDYTFSVTLSSPDTGCDQYADWWEVVSKDGQLLYRRILAHSHVNEQPFNRSGGRVNVSNNQTVIVRFHMNNLGYSPNAMRGSVSKGWKSTVLEADFFTTLENEDPLPGGCAF